MPVYSECRTWLRSIHFGVNDPIVQSALARTRGLKAIQGIAQQVKLAIKSGLKVNIVACGPLTNIALFVSVYPELLEGVGVGNRSAVAEFNILCDPEAAQIVFDAEIPKVMIPLNVTHQAILTIQQHIKMKGHSAELEPGADLLSRPSTTPFRNTLSTMLSFFASAYESTFGFVEGPPLHDPLTIAYIAYPEIFKTKRYRVDVDCSPHGALGVGQTVVDVWNYRECDDTWGSGGKNVLVAEDVDVEEFFKIFLECVDRCDRITPLNKKME